MCIYIIESLNLSTSDLMRRKAFVHVNPGTEIVVNEESCNSLTIEFPIRNVFITKIKKHYGHALNNHKISISIYICPYMPNYTNILQ